MGLTVNQWLGGFDSHIRSQKFNLPVAQLENVLVYETMGWRFESSQADQENVRG